MARIRTNRWIAASAVAVLAAGGATAAIAVSQSSSAPGDAPPPRSGVQFPGAEHTYDLPVPALNGASPDNYSTVAEADGIIAVEQRETDPGERCVIIATVSGATTRGCWHGEAKPGVLVWAYDEADGTQAVAFATDGRAASGRVGQRSFAMPAGSDIAVARLHKGEYLPIQIQNGTTDYTVSFPGGTAPR